LDIFIDFLKLIVSRTADTLFGYRGMQAAEETTGNR